MKKRHALGLSALVGLAVVVAAFAAVRSVQARDPEGSTPASPAASATAEPPALDRYEARLDAALAAARARAIDAVAPTSQGSAATPGQTIQTTRRGESDDADEHESNDHGGDQHESGWEED